MSVKRFSWTEPKLCHYSYNLSKDWFVYFTITDSITNQKKRCQFRANINCYKTKDDRVLQGNAVIRYWKDELKMGWNPFEKVDLPNKQTLAGTINFLMELKRASLRGRTIQTYDYRARIITEWILEKKLQDIELKHFSVNMANSFMDWLLLKKGFKNRTYNDFKTFISGLFTEMRRRRWITDNPFEFIQAKPTGMGRNTAFTDEERQQLKELLYQHDRELFYYTQAMFFTFIRRTELTLIKISHIDFVNMTITVPVNEDQEGAKNGIQESVVIPDAFIPILQEMYLQKLPGSWFVFGKALKPGPEQFRYPNHISDRHTRFTGKYMPGLDKEKGLYSWKHTGVCAVYKSMQVKDIYAIMRHCRHKELTTTQIYLKSLGLVDNAAIRGAAW